MRQPRPTPRRINPLERISGLITQADEATGGLLGTLPYTAVPIALNRAGIAAGQGDYAKAAEELTGVIPAGRLVTRAIRGVTGGLSDGEVGGVRNIEAPKYQGWHRAPYMDDEGFNAPLNALDRIFPSDIYSARARQFYGAGQPGEEEALRVANRVRNNPDATVTIYRAAPKGAQTEINAGDWVTPSRAYAQYHGDNVLKGQQGQDFEILERQVPARNVYTNADSLLEYGYDPTGLGIKGGLLNTGTDSTALNRYETDADRRMATAQRNAALPVSEGGLGLPPDNTPMDRAKAMGFDVNKTWYHGTDKDIGAFDPNAGQAAREGTGTNLSESPEIANTYAGRMGGNVIPALVRSSGFDEIDFQGKNWNRLPIDSIMQRPRTDESLSDYFDARYDDYVTTNDVGRLSRGMKSPGLLINEVSDRGGYVQGVGNVPDISDNMMVFDPSRIRSRFAAFDPMRRNEADLLALNGGQATANLPNFERLFGLLEE